MTHRARHKPAHRERSKERNRYNMALSSRFKRDTTPGVTPEFKELVRRELLDAHINAYETLNWFEVTD